MAPLGDRLKDRNSPQRDTEMGEDAPMTKVGRGPIDELVRDQIRAWIRYEMNHRQIDSIREFARRIHSSHAYVSRILNGESTPGIELCLRMRKYLHTSVDLMLDGYPPTTYTPHK